MNIREYSPCQCECGSGSFWCFVLWCIHPSCWIVILNFFLFLCSYLVVFFLRRTWGVRFWCSFSSFSDGAFFLRFGWSSDESFRFWHHDSKAVVLNSFRFITIWKQRSCQFFIWVSLSLPLSLSLSLSLFLARSLSLTWLLFLQLWSTLQVRNFDVFIHSFWMEPFLQYGCSDDERFWFWAMIVRLWLWNLSTVL